MQKTTLYVSCFYLYVAYFYLFDCKYDPTNDSHSVCVSSSYLGSSGGSYGVISNNRIKRRPSSHFEMEMNECEFLCVHPTLLWR